MSLQQFLLMRVERFVFAICISPPVRKSRRYFAWEKSAEKRVARVRRRCRKNCEVVRGLYVEERSEQRLENAPLIETQAIDDNEYCRAVALKNGKNELADDVDRERRPVSLEVLEPLRIFRLHEARKLAVHVG